MRNDPDRQASFALDQSRDAQICYAQRLTIRVQTLVDSCSAGLKEKHDGNRRYQG